MLAPGARHEPRAFQRLEFWIWRFGRALAEELLGFAIAPAHFALRDRAGLRRLAELLIPRPFLGRHGCNPRLELRTPFGERGDLAITPRAILFRQARDVPQGASRGQPAMHWAFPAGARAWTPACATVAALGATTRQR